MNDKDDNDGSERSSGNSYAKSSLTHQLPQVSRKFRDWTLADSYWKDAVLRQTKKEPGLWQTALKNIIAERVLGLPQDVRVDKNVAFDELKQG